MGGGWGEVVVGWGCEIGGGKGGGGGGEEGAEGKENVSCRWLPGRGRMSGVWGVEMGMGMGMGTGGWGFRAGWGW